MQLTYRQYHQLFRAFFKRELLVFRNEFKTSVINIFTWPVMTSLMYGYAMQGVGLEISYGSFITVGVIVAGLIYGSYARAAHLSNDMAGKRYIDFELTLPLPSWLVFVKYTCAFAFHSFVFAIPTLIVAKLVLFDRFSFQYLNVVGFISLTTLAALLTSLFALMICGAVSTSYFPHARIRLFDPLFYLGCHMVSWVVMKETLPILAWITRVNPATHLMESLRAMVLGPQRFLPIVLTVPSLLIFMCLFFYGMIYFMRKRLDFV